MSTQSSELTATILRALKAYKVEQGLSEEEAKKWADDHFTEGSVRVNAVLAAHRQDMETGFQEAFVGLKAWARATS